MSKFDAVTGRAEKYLRRNNFRANLFLGLIVLFSLLITVAGFAFIGYVSSLINEIKEASMMLMSVAPNGGTGRPIGTPTQLASIVGENTMWVPIMGGIIILLLPFIYLFRIHVRRSMEFEDELIRNEKFMALEGDGEISRELENAVLASTRKSTNQVSPEFLPTVELAEKSINSISNIVSKSSGTIRRFRKRT